MAEQAIKEVRGLVVPLDGMRLILPDSIVLQILTSIEIKTLDDSPKWLLGSLEWQKRHLPLLSYEAASSYGERAVDVNRVLILKSMNHIDRMPFYAITLSGIPHPVVLNDANLQEVASAGASSPLVLNQVLVEGEPASIPNLDALEEMLMSQYGLFQESETVMEQTRY